MREDTQRAIEHTLDTLIETSIATLMAALEGRKNFNLVSMSALPCYAFRGE